MSIEDSNPVEQLIDERMNTLVQLIASFRFFNTVNLQNFFKI